MSAPGALLFGYFLLGKQEKVPRPHGRNQEAETAHRPRGRKQEAEAAPRPTGRKKGLKSTVSKG